MPEQRTKNGKLDTAIRLKTGLIEVAGGSILADLVLKNARYVNVFTGELLQGDIAVFEGYIAGMGIYSGKREIDMHGKILCPGFIDAHIHLESSMVCLLYTSRCI